MFGEKKGICSIKEDTLILRRYLIIASQIVLLLLFTGCVIRYVIEEPIVGSLPAESLQKDSIQILINDMREDTAFHSFNLPIAVKLNNIPDEIDFLKRSLNNEFYYRGLPIKLYTDTSLANGCLKLKIYTYKITSHRVSAFSPWESYHQFHANLITNKDTIPLFAYFYNGKLPNVSMKEVEETCFNIPMSIIVGEIASKINQSTLNAKVSDKLVDSLSKEIDNNIGMWDNGPFWQVLALGHSNNQLAMAKLKELTYADDQFVRACALSAMGTLGCASELFFLIKRYEETTGIDKIMAMKSIAGIGTQQSMQFTEEEQSHSQEYEKENGFKYCVDLYLSGYQNKNLYFSK